MEEMSYSRILADDAADQAGCTLKWDCKNCTKTLCINLVSVADFARATSTRRGSALDIASPLKVSMLVTPVTAISRYFIRRR